MKTVRSGWRNEPTPLTLVGRWPQITRKTMSYWPLASMMEVACRAKPNWERLRRCPPTPPALLFLSLSGPPTSLTAAVADRVTERR